MFSDTWFSYLLPKKKKLPPQGLSRFVLMQNNMRTHVLSETMWRPRETMRTHGCPTMWRPQPWGEAGTVGMKHLSHPRHSLRMIRLKKLPPRSSASIMAVGSVLTHGFVTRNAFELTNSAEDWLHPWTTPTECLLSEYLGLYRQSQRNLLKGGSCWSLLCCFYYRIVKAVTGLGRRGRGWSTHHAHRYGPYLLL